MWYNPCVPALPPAASVLRIRLKGALGDLTDVGTRFYMKYGGTAPTNAQLNTFATAVGTAWASNIAPLTGDDYTLTEVDVEDLTSATAAIGVATVSHIGTRSGSQLPASTVMVIAYAIDRRYRGGHPRGYWNYGVEADLATPQTWTSGFIASAGPDTVNFINAVAAAGWSGAGTLSQVSVSYYSGFVASENPITGRWRNIPKPRVATVVDDVVGVTARTRVGSQRKRNL